MEIAQKRKWKVNLHETSKINLTILTTNISNDISIDMLYNYFIDTLYYSIQCRLRTCEHLAKKIQCYMHANDGNRNFSSIIAPIEIRMNDIHKLYSKCFPLTRFVTLFALDSKNAIQLPSCFMEFA